MFHVKPPHEHLLRKHLAWVLATNRIHNLTAITDEPRAWRLHVLDSLGALGAVNSAPPGELLDIGTGGGFPGVPLGVVSGRPTLCIDSINKKTHALEEFLRSDEGYSRIHARTVRAEALALEQPSHYAAVVLRAVATLNSLVELSAPLLMMQGRCLCFKGAVGEDEMYAGDLAAQRCGLVRKQIRNYMIGDGSEIRCVVEYEKVAEPTLHLPRRIGIAQKRPLA